MKYQPQWRAFSVEIAIVVVALSIIVAAIVSTRPEMSRQKAAELATAADGSATATAGPDAGRAPNLAGGAAPSGQDVSASCRTATGVMGEGRYGSIDLLIPVGKPAANVADGGQMSRGDGYKLLGWAIGPSGDRLVSSVCLVVDGKVDARSRVRYGLPRPDVAAAYHRDEIAASGFEIDVPAGLLTLGRHRLQVVSLTTARMLELLPPVRNVTVY